MPDWKNVVRERLASLRLHGPAESDLAEEIGQHQERNIRLARGLYNSAGCDITVLMGFQPAVWGRLASGVQIEGRERRSQSEALTTILNTVDLNYFDTAGIPLEQGRGFTGVDREDSAGAALLRRHDLVCAKQRRAGTILLPVQREMRALGPHILINDIRTGRTIIDNGLFGPKLGVMLLSLFGLLALGLASVGLYGAMAYSVNQRKREIGVRMALGAARENVLRLILKEGLTLVVSGMIIGFIAALMLGRVLSRLLFGIRASDPVSAAAASLVLLTIALLACYLPARRASRIDPLVALREG
jgi:hypothetical protein